MAQRRILLTGATGFIGRNLVVRLLAKGHRLTVLSRRPSGASDPNLTWHVVDDLADTVPASELGRGVDTLIHLAAAQKPTSSGTDASRSDNARAAENIASFARSANIARLAVVSSIAARVAQETPHLARQYGIEKLASEAAFPKNMAQGQNVVFLRPPAVYGTGMSGSLNTLAALLRKGLPLPLGLATAPRHYISVANLCGLLETMAESDDARWQAARGRVFEPSDGQAISTRDLVASMAAVMGKRAWLLPVPMSLLHLLGKATGKDVIVGSAIDRLDMADLSDLEAAFGWRPSERIPESLSFLRAAG